MCLKYKEGIMKTVRGDLIKFAPEGKFDIIIMVAIVSARLELGLPPPLLFERSPY